MAHTTTPKSARNGRTRRKPIIENYAPAGDNGAEGAKTTITLSYGVTAELSAIPILLIEKIRAALEREWADAGKVIPSVPTYTTEIAGGATQTHEHNLTTLTTPADHAAWAEYVASKNTWDRENNLRTIRAILLYGVKMDMPEDDGWAEAQTAIFGIKVPTERTQRYLHYLETEVLRSPDDIAAIMGKVMALSGISEEEVQAAAATFPGDVQQEAAG